MKIKRLKYISNLYHKNYWTNSFQIIVAFPLIIYHAIYNFETLLSENYYFPHLHNVANKLRK